MALSGEALLISALLNNHEVAAAANFGVVPVHFKGYQDEYNWLLQYSEQYGEDPSWDAFSAAFPSFPKSTHENTRSAVDMVFKSYGKSQLQEAMSDAFDHLSTGDVEGADKLLKDVTIRRTAPKPRRLLTDLDFLDNWDESHRGRIEVPYRALQQHTGGIRPGNIWYLAARPGQGKSAHLVNIAKKAVLDGCKVKFYSLEMSEDEVRFRFHAALAAHYGYKGINLNDLRDRRVDAHTYKTFVSELQEKLEDTGGYLDIHTPRQGMVTPSTVAAAAEDYDLNIVDYVGLMRADDGVRAVADWRTLASISNDLKAIALSAQTGMLVASQINREGESGKNPPRLVNLAQSDALGQDGDVVVTMRALPHNVGTAFSLEKNRHGLGGIQFYSTFDLNTGVFDEITKEQSEDMAAMAEEL